RGLRTRLTFDPALNVAPIWSPDGTRIVFSSNRRGNMNLYQKASSGAGSDEAVLKSDVYGVPYSWSRDGRYLLYTSGDPGSATDLWVLPWFGEKKPFPFLQTRFAETRAKFSPDGRWVAYTSNESGRNEVYVTLFPKADGKWQVSTGGGTSARWRQDGRELF